MRKWSTAEWRTLLFIVGTAITSGSGKMEGEAREGQGG